MRKILLIAGALLLAASASSAFAQGYYRPVPGYGYEDPNSYYARQRAGAVDRAEARQELRAYGNPGCDFSALQRSDGSNPSYPAGWVHDPITQKWLEPNSPQAQLACVHQGQVNAQQGINQVPNYSGQYGYGYRYGYR